MNQQRPIQKIPNLLRTPDRSSPPDTSAGSSGRGERRRSWKLLTFDILAVGLAVFLGYYTLLQFAGGANFILFLCVAGLFFAVSFYASLLAGDSRHRAIVILLQIVAFLAFFYSVSLSTILGAFAVLAVFYFLAVRSSMLIAGNTLKFMPAYVSRAYIKKIFVGFTLAIILLYLPQGSSGNVFVSRERFQQWYQATASLAQRFSSGIDFHSTVGTFAEGIVRAQVSVNPQFRALTPEMQEEAVRRGAQELVSSTADSIGLALTSDMPLADAVYQYLVDLFTKFRDQFGQSFVAVWGVALFAIAWSLGTIFVWLVVLLSFLIYELLAAMNVIQITGETRTKEMVELA